MQLESSFTLARKTLASITALMCRNQPEFSSPVRKSLMEGDFISHTGSTQRVRTAPPAPPHYSPENSNCLQQYPA